MADRSVIQIDFSGGADDRTDARHVVPGKLLSLKNGVFEKGGSIRKRRGYTALSRLTFAGVTIAAAYQLASFGSELVLHDGDALYSRSGNADRWTTHGAFPRVAIVRTPIAHSSKNMKSPDVAYGSGYLVQVWREDSGGATAQICVTVTDVASASKVFSSFSLGAAGGAADAPLPRAVVLGTKAYVFWSRSDTGQINVRTLDLTSPTTWTATAAVIADAYVNTALRFDACALSDRIALVYTNNGAGNRITVKTFDAALAQLATINLTSTTDTAYNYAICGVTGERIWVTYASVPTTTLTLKVQTLNPTTLAEINTSVVTSGTTVTENPFVGVARISATRSVITWFELNGSNPILAQYQIVDAATAPVGSGSVYRHLWASKPFAVGARCYAVANYAQLRVTPNSYGSLVELPMQAGTNVISEVARFAPQRTITPYGSFWIASSVVPTTPGRYVACVVIRNLSTLGIESASFDFGISQVSAPQELGSSLHFAGGVPSVYDGARVLESTFPLPAESPYSVSQVTGSGAIANGTYNYCVVFVRTDAKGQIYRSAPSIPTQVVVAGANATSNQVTFRVPMMPITRASDPTISSYTLDTTLVVYRTKAGGSTFFELTDAVNWGYVTASNSGTAVNDPSQPYVVIQDSLADASVTGTALLYTTGGILENSPVPSAKIQLVHKDRLWLAGTDDPNVIWFSKQRVFPEGVGFNPIQTIIVEDGGDVAALASLDSHLIIFKRDRIFYVDGDGPPDTGGEGFTPPQRISADLGCIEPRSVALTPDGIFFQSSAGIYLLSRGLGVQYASGPVENTLAAYPIITSAVVHDSQFHVRFSCTTTDGTSGVVLVFDYLVKEWAVFELYEAVAAAPRAAIVAACSRAGSYVWVAGNGAVYEESATSFTDAGTWVTLELVTSWLKVGGLQGWQRAWSMALLGERFTPHDLVIEVANDYASAYHQTKTWTDVVIAALPLEQIRTALVRQKCQAVRFRISDATPTGGGAVGSGRGLAFTGIAIEAAILRKTKRLGAAQRG